ncbi:helix-turn-helix domain-containing protein [Nocardia wallacei]|uniref:helix-turn-helix domain-containing protein n=1 Tax=Nocardia wallacei TaxID=480035 RepID=UPI002458A53B|nr:helix-turn-helix domain-containing protein [Nocardia wallacei]
MTRAYQPAQMPEFYDWIATAREHLGLTIEAATAHTAFTASWLSKIENERRSPTQDVVEQLARVYRFNRSQRRHALDLWKTSATLAPTDDLRRHISPAAHAHLDHLDTRRMAAGYLDPLGTVLLANKALRYAIPGLDTADDNVLLWLFTPIARDIMPHWEHEAVHGVANLRGAIGRYRDTPQAQQFWRKLVANNDFNRLWTEHPLLVAYGRHTRTPINLHHPDSGEPMLLSLEISETSRPDILVTYAFYDHPALAC